MKKFILLIPLILSLMFIGCDTSEAVYSNVQLIDENGVPYGVAHIDGKMFVTSQDYLYDIAEGNIANHYPWVKSGYNPNIGITQEAIWGFSTGYAFPAAEMQMTIVSSDNTQDKPGGTGALEVTIHFLDSNYAEFEETVSLNGTSAVNTIATNIYRVNFFRVTSTGSGGKPVGNITLRGTVDSVVYSYILAGYNRANSIIYTVPAGKTLYVTSVAFSCAEAAKGVRFSTMANYDNINDTMLTAGIMFMSYTDIELYNNVYYRELEMPTKFKEKTDIKVVAVSTQAGAIGSCSLRGWLEDN